MSACAPPLEFGAYAGSDTLAAHAEAVSATAERPRSGCLTAARVVVLLAVGQSPVGPALLSNHRGRRFGHGLGLGHALERELRFRPGALHIDRDDLAGPQLAEQDLLGQVVLDLPLDRAPERVGAENSAMGVTWGLPVGRMCPLPARQDRASWLFDCCI